MLAYAYACAHVISTIWHVQPSSLLGILRTWCQLDMNSVPWRVLLISPWWQISSCCAWSLTRCKVGQGSSCNVGWCMAVGWAPAAVGCGLEELPAVGQHCAARRGPEMFVDMDRVLVCTRSTSNIFLARLDFGMFIAAKGLSMNDEPPKGLFSTKSDFDWGWVTWWFWCDRYCFIYNGRDTQNHAGHQLD